MRILVAHERPAIGRATAAILAAYGFEVAVVDRGEAALRALAGGRWDGAVLDAGVPGAAIHELIARAKDGPNQVPAVVLIATVFKRRSYRRGPTSNHGADAIVEVHRIADTLPTTLWGLFARKDPESAAIAEAEMALWTLRQDRSRGVDRLADLLVAGAVLERADEVADVDDRGRLQSLLGGRLHGLRDHLAAVMGGHEHDGAIDRAFQAIVL
ncbi:MAG: hypothetical protein R3B09_16295 [Nannocystaceae bacterium]